MSSNSRLEAFCSPQVFNCFQSIVHESEIWKRDPYDVESIHPKAREGFDHLIHQVRNEHEGVGKIWLIKGEAGAGKTHLMRVFRNHLHDTGSGYFSYMQMTSAERNYPRYILRHTLESLDKPYADDPTGSITGLMRLSRTLAETQAAVHPDQLRKLQEADLKPDELIELVFSLADGFITLDEFGGIDLGLIRALLFLQYDDAPLKRRVMSYLRCERMLERDERWLGMPARTDDDAPQTFLKSLTYLIWALDAGVLVLCLDQLEYMYRDDADSAQRFRSAIQATNTLISHCPRLLVLVSCLEDYYQPLRQQLPRSELDRIENDPSPTVINAFLRREAIKGLIARRLEVLYESTHVEFDDTNPLYPFQGELIDALDGQSIRGILDRCRELRDQGIRTKQIPQPDWPGTAPIPPKPRPSPQDTPTEETLLAWKQRWNDFLTKTTSTPLRDDVQMKYVLAETIKHCGDELNQHYQFGLNLKGNNIVVDTLHNDHSLGSIVVTLCNKSARGGALAKQLSKAESSTTPERLIIARNTPFPANPKTKVAQQIVQLLTRGMKRVVIEDSDWRAMVAMRKFKEQYGKHEGFFEWLKANQPLSLRPALKTILELINIQKPELPEDIEPTPKPDVPPELVDTKADTPIKPTMDSVSMLQLGLSRDYKPEPVTININHLTRHAAFLGGSGSGKTTLALNIIEQLLQQGIPALMIDRKGDLASYAQAYQLARHSESSDKQKLGDAAESLLERLDVALYTPGNSQGRPLSIPIIPQGMEQLPTNEREQIARYTAGALGGMMKYKDTGPTQTRKAILTQAISVLAELSTGVQIVLNDLIEFIASENSELVYAIGQLETRHFRKLVEDLQTLQLMHGNLFAEEGELLDFEALLGLGKFQLAGRARLSIVSTTFLGDTSNVLFWIAQLLLEIDRYRRRQPSDRLQCVILFDEADLYLPATSKPATKEPLENLLRRGRSAGIGLMLATQSPGDLDYNSRDQISSWFLGRIRESNSLNRLRPMLSQTKLDIENKLPTQETGEFFCISEGQVTSLSAQNSLIKVEQISEDSILKLARS